MGAALHGELRTSISRTNQPNGGLNAKGLVLICATRVGKLPRRISTLEKRKKALVIAAFLVLLSVTASMDAIPKAHAAVVVQEVATGLEAPWSIAFSSNGTIYLTERPGRVRVIKDGVLQDNPVARVNVATLLGGEAGLLGLALDPDFDSNRLAYLYYTYSDLQSNPWNRVSSFTENNGNFTNEHVLLDGIRGANIHDGGRLKIGPDRKLYITTGDGGIPTLAQDPSSLNGKILRINLDGSIPTDNPSPGSAVYSLGHRNPQGLTWDRDGHLIESEHGPSANDEINIILPGRNYGWPNVTGSPGNPSFEDPVLSTGQDTWAPSGIAYYSSNLISEWTNRVLVATLRGEHLQVLQLDFAGSPTVVASSSLFQGVFGRLRDVVQGPDGAVYLATSNRDGRGSPQTGDDKILRIAENPAPPVIDSEISVGLAFIAAEALIVGVPLLISLSQGKRNAQAVGICQLFSP